MCPKTPPPGRSPPSSLAPTAAGHITGPGTEQPLRRRLDGPVPRERAARQGADRAGDRAAADHPQGADAARRSRRAAARQAGGVPARRPRHHEDAHSRPYTSSDNPYSESNFKTLKYRPEFPERFDDIEHARAHCRAFFRLVQPRPPPLRDRPDDPSRRPPRPGDPRCTPPAHACSTPPTRATPNGSSARRRSRPELPTAAWINKPDTKEVAH